jgi:hypothetical protein
LASETATQGGARRRSIKLTGMHLMSVNGKLGAAADGAGGALAVGCVAGAGSGFVSSAMRVSKLGRTQLAKCMTSRSCRHAVSCGWCCRQ